MAEPQRLTRAKALIAKCASEAFAANKRWKVADRLQYLQGLIPTCYGLKAKDISALHRYAEQLAKAA